MKMEMDMRTSIKGCYLDWAFLDYQPVMKEISLENLHPFLTGVKTALDIGCNKGYTCISLAQRDINVIGISLNSAEIDKAQHNARITGVRENTLFLVGDVLTEEVLETYDLVLMTRLLTCFPDPGNWRRMLKRAFELVKPGGLVYIYDFLYYESNPVYIKRYRDGQEKGWPKGNFEVKDPQGKYLFIAHHHSLQELETIIQPYKKLKLSKRISLSMHGNKAKIFEFIGRKAKTVSEKTEKIVTVDLKNYKRDEAPQEMVKAAIQYEVKFGIRFHSLTVFPLEIMAKLHREPVIDLTFEERVIVTSRKDNGILGDMARLGEIVNRSSISFPHRRVYFQTLQRIYRKLPNRPDAYLEDSDSLFVAPKREGQILAKVLGWLPKGRSLTPEAKRIPYKEGLIIGLDKLKLKQKYKRCLIIDGAMASGATVISIIQQIKDKVNNFQIYSVHAPREGVSALLKYGADAGIEIRIILGHITTGLNQKYYAIYPGDENRQVVGDLGDTISEIVGSTS